MAADEINVEEQFKSLRNIFTRKTAMTTPRFDGEEVLDMLQEDFVVLVVGAGGLGCELLKNLALSGVKDIHVIDLDTIELSNLNRQFLFREKDIGQPKSTTAANFVMQRVPGVKITAHHKPIQEYDSEFYTQFNCVIAGLDNVAARRWLNAKLWSLVDYDDDGNLDPDSIIPLIDGGTEGFKGHVRIFVPGLSSCFDCSLGAMPPQTGYAICTLQGKPRKPEHCVAYAHKLLWPRLKRLDGLEDDQWELARTKDEAGDGVTWDSDNAMFMTWMYQRALERADEFKIEGVTYNLTMQVTKNIIPAIASTNALVSAGCVAEALKVLTACSGGLDNWLMYMGQNGCYTRTMKFEKVENCLVCAESVKIKENPETTLEDFMKRLRMEHKFKTPSILANKKTWYHPIMKSQLEGNLKKTLVTLSEGETDIAFHVADPSLAGKTVKFNLKLEDGVHWTPPEEE